MSTYRERMRAAGLRPVQLWVPDTRSPEFLAKCRADALAVAKLEEGDEVLKEWELLEDAWESIEPYEP